MKRPFNIHCKTLEDQKFDTISVLDYKFQLNCTKLSKTEHKRNAVTSKNLFPGRKNDKT